MEKGTGKLRSAAPSPPSGGLFPVIPCDFIKIFKNRDELMLMDRIDSQRIIAESNLRVGDDVVLYDPETKQYVRAVLQMAPDGSTLVGRAFLATMAYEPPLGTPKVNFPVPTLAWRMSSASAGFSEALAKDSEKTGK